MLGMFDWDRFSNRVELQAFFAGEDSETDRRPKHGVNEQNHQHRMSQAQPVVRAYGFHGQSNHEASTTIFRE
jgi:hypothetical protein